ncbi:MAG: DUF3095 domain-containing protein [Chloroflexi bacterium]|nr:DUF3095 domain-containing protein [Chloroflexota bacterium]
MPHNFYATLPIITDFVQITDANCYHRVPDDWVIVVSDIEQSTKAIGEGRYKDVNFIGASTIVALLNLQPNLDIPFVFGGDGATVLLPPWLVEQAKPALQAVQHLSESIYNLHLRVGIMPVSEVYAHRYQLEIAKFAASDNYAQAMINGDGLTFVEQTIKDPVAGAKYLLAAQPSDQPGLLDGLECRWQEIPSRYGETVSLLVRAEANTTDQRNAINRQVIEQIEAIYGADDSHHPVDVQQLSLTLRIQDLWGEARLRGGSSKLQQLRYLNNIWWLNVLGKLLLATGAKTELTDWAEYPQILQASTDYRKYDAMLRMVIAGTPQQRQQLEQFLNAERAAGRLNYGLHVSDSALMTCIVFERMGRQVHFIDGNNGGYAKAADQLKQQSHYLEPPVTTKTVSQPKTGLLGDTSSPSWGTC